jgi:hypothetical protein
MLWCRVAEIAGKGGTGLAKGSAVKSWFKIHGFHPAVLISWLHTHGMQALLGTLIVLVSSCSFLLACSPSSFPLRRVHPHAQWALPPFLPPRRVSPLHIISALLHSVFPSIPPSFPLSFMLPSSLFPLHFLSRAPSSLCLPLPPSLLPVLSCALHQEI